MKASIKNTVLLIFTSLLSITFYGQDNSVGINTTNPNPNAVLELVSPNNNQGFLVPRLTTAQRTDVAFVNSLSASEQGLLVYDITVQSLYWWNGSAWNTINAGSYIAGTGINIDASNNIINTSPDVVVSLTGSGATSVSGTYPNFTIASSDAQNMTITGNAVSITGGTGYNLSATAPTDGQVLTWNNTLSQWESSTTSVNTDAQAISLTTNTLSITGNPSTVDLSGYLDNTDAQNVSMSGNAVSITGGTGYNLSATAPSDGQVLTWNNTLSQWESSTPAANTDAQAISLATNTLSITGNPSTVDLSGYLDNTDAQNMSITGNAVSITGGTGFNLSATAPTDDGQVLTWNNTLSRWEALDVPAIYSAGDGITIDGSNVIHSLWASSGGSDVILATSTNNVGIGQNPDAGYKLTVSGRFKSGGIDELSDKRWKKDITPLNNSLEKLLKLQGVTYNWRIDEFPDKNFTQKTEIGLIAQEVEKLFPEIVNTNADGYKSVQYSHIVAILIEAIKEQQAIIERQNEKLQEIKFNDLDQFKAHLNEQNKKIQVLMKYMQRKDIGDKLIKK